MTIDHATLAEAEAALRAAAITSPEDTRPIRWFMLAVEQLVRSVAAGTLRWEETAEGAHEHADQVMAARRAFGEWAMELGSIFYSSGGEEGTESALRRRSQQAFARELFKGTAADAMLAMSEDAEVDQGFRQETVRIGLSAPEYIPESHTWWPP